MNHLPVLYSFRRCPYAMRARLAIASNGRPCELREIVLRDKAPEFVAASAKATVPVLVGPGGPVLEESLDIMKWALEDEDPEKLLPANPADADATRELVDDFDGPFKKSLDRYKYANRHAGADPIAERGMASKFLMALDAQLTSSPWLFGERPAFADLAILPFVRQFASVDRQWFDEQSWSNLRAWLDRFLASPRFLAVMAKYPKWRAGDAVQVFPGPRPVATGSVGFDLDRQARA